MARFDRARFVSPWVLGMLLMACSADDQIEADRMGLGGGCQVDRNCTDRAGEAAEGYDLTCFVSFSGGLCAIDQCDSEDDCPDGSGCVFHDDGQSYCFRLCEQDAECNQYRNDDVPADCTSNAQFAGSEDLADASACIPPASAR